MLVVLGIWISVGLLIWRDREDSLHAAAQLTESLTRVVAERTNGALRAVDFALLDVAARLSVRGAGDKAAVVEVMRYRAANLAEVRSLFFIDAGGIVRVSTLESMEGAALGHRAYFQEAQAGGGRSQPIVTGPLFSKFTDRVGILVLRPVLDAKGAFLGVVAAAVNPDFFKETLSGVTAETTDRSVIATLAGDVLARMPEMEGQAVASIRSGPLFTEHLPRARSGSFLAPSSFDGLDRLASYQVLERYPIVVSVGVTEQAALRRWTFTTVAIALAGAAFTVLVVVIALLLDRRHKGQRAAARALEASAERYRLLAEGQTDLIHRYRPDTTLIAYNQAYADFYGNPEGDLMGRKWIDFAPTAERGEILAILASMTPSQPSREDRRKVTRRDGGECWIEWRTTAEFDERGRPTGYQTVGRDVTDAYMAQKAIAEREELYSQSFHRNPATKLLVDPESGMVVDANDAAAAFYGYPVDVLKRMDISEINIIPPEQIKAEMAAVLREGRMFLRFKHRLASGSIRDVEVYSSPLHVGGRTYLSSIVVDVTERNHFEAELAAKSEELSRSNAELERFAYVASHDLRQPLRMVSSYVTLLGRSLRDKLTPDETDYMGFAVAGVKRMDALILGLLEYSRVGRGGEPPGPHPLSAVVEAAAANLGLGQANSDAVLDVEPPLPVVRGVPSELVRLFQNLMGNALKYRHPDRPPHLRIGARRDGAEWVVWVEDNGIGIEPQYFDRIFQMFQRLHADSAYEGTGIGLAICQKIVRTYGGRLWVDSVPGEGSRFNIAFPVIDPSPGLGEPESPIQKE